MCRQKNEKLLRLSRLSIQFRRDLAPLDQLSRVVVPPPPTIKLLKTGLEGPSIDKCMEIITEQKLAHNALILPKK